MFEKSRLSINALILTDRGNFPMVFVALRPSGPETGLEEINGDLLEADFATMLSDPA